MTPRGPNRVREVPRHLALPSVSDFFRPVVAALRELGGSGSVDEIDRRTIELMNIPEEVTAIPQNPDTDTRSLVEYRLAWARTYLKNAGILDNSSRGVWALISGSTTPESIDATAINRKARERSGVRVALGQTDEQELPPADFLTEWRRQLHHALTKELSPAGFERLSMRLLREAGFTQVEVTGRSGDGGIDGKGIARVSGVLSFHVVFQCKRYVGSVTPSQVRDFRGAMQGRADKGILITTGSFTKEAVREATRDGAPAIDLIDGDRLADMLKELKLGLSTELVERVTVDESWFRSLEDA
jgi:restriction system protein